MTTVVIACDKFKGSAAAEQIATALTAGLRRGAPQVQTRFIPVADGGDGTVDAALSAGFDERRCWVTGPFGEQLVARYALSEEGTAVLEAAEACGLRLLKRGRESRDLPGGDQHDAAAADTFGVGQLILAALDEGASHLIVGLGGSATTDAGAGLARALGVRILTRRGEPVGPGGAGLVEAGAVDLSGLDPRVARARFTVASDVTNPLTGAQGAAAVYGGQKGVREEQIPQLDAALARYARLIEAEVGVSAGTYAQAEGSGAAGGLGFAALALLGAQMRPGADLVLEMTGYEDALEGADLVITGEGSLDEQTLQGKAPAVVAARAARRGIPVVAVCGAAHLSEEQAQSVGIGRIHTLLQLQPEADRAVADPLPLVERIGEELGKELRHPATG